MLLLGILGILQQIFLPGYIFLTLVRIKNLSPIQLFTYSVGLSLFLNYQIILLLNYLDLYIRVSVFILIFIEFVIIFWKRKELVKPTYPVTQILSRIKEFSQNWLFIAVCSVLLFYTALFLLSIGSVFFYFDAFIGKFYFDDHMGFWYKYGIYWAQDLFPPKSYYFPQLWAANWSISHVLTSDLSITLFNKIIMQLFPIGILLLFADLAIKKRRQIFLVGMICVSVMIPLFYSVLFLVDGNPELSVMFFSFLAFYFFYLYKDDLFEWKNLLLITFFASGAALVKLSGFSIVFLLCCWMGYNFLFTRNHTYRYKSKYMLVLIFLVGLNLVWYAIKPMYTGLDQSFYFRGETAIGRFLMGLNLISSNFGLPIFIILIGLYLLSFLNKDSRFTSFFIILPIMGIYIARYAYSTRNASITIPLLAFVIPFGVKVLLNKYAFKLRKIQYKERYILLAAIGVIILFSIPAIYDLVSSINYFLRAKIFNFTQERLDAYMGYQKHYEYFIDAVRISGVLVIITLILRRINLNWNYIALSAVGILLVLNFTLINKEFITHRQQEAIQDIAVYNFEQLIPLYTDKSEFNIISNTELDGLSTGKIIVDKNLSEDHNVRQNFIFWEKQENRNYHFQNYEVIYDDLSYSIYTKK